MPMSMVWSSRMKTGMKLVLFEPNQEILDDMRRIAPREVSNMFRNLTDTSLFLID